MIDAGILDTVQGYSGGQVPGFLGMRCAMCDVLFIDWRIEPEIAKLASYFVLYILLPSDHGGGGMCAFTEDAWCWSFCIFRGLIVEGGNKQMK